MTCHTAETYLQRGLDEALTQAERAHLDAHLETCAACRLERDAQRRLAQLAGVWADSSLAASDPGEAFNLRLLARLDTTPAHPPLAWGLPLAAALLLVTALFFLPGLSTGTSALPRLLLTLHGLPHWLAVNLRALPGDMLTLWPLSLAAFGPLWTRILLPVMLGLNALLCLHVRQAARRRSTT